MKKQELTCIGCPLGCAVTVESDENGISRISGNTCRRGAEYAENEVTHPKRMLTTTVRVSGGADPVISVKTREAIPKELISACAEYLKNVTVPAPLAIGDCVVKDILGSGVDVIATKGVRQ